MGQRILLADDSHTIRKVVELTFADSDYEVVSVPNGEIALQRIREMRPDLILLDVIMPGKDGYSVCEFVKADPSLSDIPVLLMAGSFEPFDKERAQRAGSDGFLSKPFDSRSLVSRVGELLESARRKPAAPTPPPPVPEPPEQVIAIPEEPQPSPDSTMIFPAFKEVHPSEGIGFQDFASSTAVNLEKIVVPPPPPAAPPEVSFADLAEDLREWDRGPGTRPLPVVPPAAPAEPAGEAARPLEPGGPPAALPETEGLPLWRMEPTPISLQEIPKLRPELVQTQQSVRTPEEEEIAGMKLPELPTEAVIEEPSEEPLIIEESEQAAAVGPELMEAAPPAAEPIELLSEEPMTLGEIDRTEVLEAPAFTDRYEETFDLEAAASVEPAAVETPLEGAGAPPFPEAVPPPRPEEVTIPMSLGPAEAPAVELPEFAAEAPAEEQVEVHRLDLETPPAPQAELLFEEEPVAPPSAASVEEAAAAFELPPPVSEPPARAEPFPWEQAAAAAIEEPAGAEIAEPLFEEAAPELGTTPEALLEEAAAAAPEAVSGMVTEEIEEPQVEEGVATPAPTAVEPVAASELFSELFAEEAPAAAAESPAEELPAEAAVARLAEELPPLPPAAPTEEPLVEEAPAIQPAAAAEQPVAEAVVAALPEVMPAEVPAAPALKPSHMETIPDIFKSEAPAIRVDTLPPEMIDAIAQRVVALMSESVIQQIAWEVVPDLAEILIRKEIERLQKGM